MHRSICTGNKLCFRHDLETAWAAHEKRMKHTKSSLDTGRPVRRLASPSRKEALREQHLDRVDKENVILLQKMDSIYNRSTRRLDSEEAEMIPKRSCTLSTLNTQYR